VRNAPTEGSKENADPGRGIKRLLARTARAHIRSKARRLNTRSDFKSGLRSRPLRWSPRRHANPSGKRQQALTVHRAYKPVSKMQASRDKRRAPEKDRKASLSRARKLQDAIDAIRQGRWLLI